MNRKKRIIPPNIHSVIEIRNGVIDIDTDIDILSVPSSEDASHWMRAFFSISSIVNYPYMTILLYLIILGLMAGVIFLLYPSNITFLSTIIMQLLAIIWGIGFPMVIILKEITKDILIKYYSRIF